MGRVLGVDFGLRRVGFALSDDDQIVAMPLSVSLVQSDDEAANAVAAHAEEHGVEKVVILGYN